MAEGGEDGLGECEDEGGSGVEGRSGCAEGGNEGDCAVVGGGNAGEERLREGDKLLGVECHIGEDIGAVGYDAVVGRVGGAKE